MNHIIISMLPFLSLIFVFNTFFLSFSHGCVVNSWTFQLIRNPGLFQPERQNYSARTIFLFLKCSFSCECSMIPVRMRHQAMPDLPQMNSQRLCWVSVTPNRLNARKSQEKYFPVTPILGGAGFVLNKLTQWYYLTGKLLVAYQT